MLLAEGKDEGAWRKLGTWPEKESSYFQSPELIPVLQRIAESSIEKGCTWEQKKAGAENERDVTALALRLEMEETEKNHIAVLVFDGLPTEKIYSVVNTLKLVADTPSLYHRSRSAHQAVSDAAQFTEALDLTALLNSEKKYMSSLMLFVNEIASRYHCLRVSIGWLESGYVHMQAISHMERFEKKMDIVQTLEVAMEESLDQNEEILWPPVEGSTAVVRDHESFSHAQGTQFIISLPIRVDEIAVGVLTCERSETPFSEGEVLRLRLLCDQAARRLDDLKKNDRWIGARMAGTLREGASRLLGVEHTFAKFAALFVCCLLIFLMFGKIEYRVEAPFILRSDDVRYIPAPFEGYIDKVIVEIGKEVKEGDLLLTLDTGDLLLEESAAIANQIRYSREAEKSRADNSLAEMKIALALADQAKAQLDLVRYRLSRADVRAPFSGIVVEGDLEELQGAAIKKGDVLFKISRIDTMYAELEVSERDIHDMSKDISGEMAFVSQPWLKYPLRIGNVDPVAVAREEGNVFLVKGTFVEDSDNWWRPGMSGITKINMGKRNVLWIITHRTVDFFRILLWW